MLATVLEMRENVVPRSLRDVSPGMPWSTRGKRDFFQSLRHTDTRPSTNRELLTLAVSFLGQESRAEQMERSSSRRCEGMVSTLLNVRAHKQSVDATHTGECQAT
jgi:hypothetical protein